MTEPLDRNTVIDLLNRLGGEQDADILAAARELRDRIAAAGLTWDDLLVGDTAEEDEDEPAPPPPARETIDDEPDDGPDDGPDDEPGDEPDDEPDDEPEPASQAGPAGTDADALALIEKMLANPEISDELREELADYKADIAEGEFDQADRRYVRALSDRLG